MKVCKLITICFCLFLCSCVSANHFIKTLDRNPNLALSEAEEKIGKPTEVVKVAEDSSIICHIYGSPKWGQAAAYFVKGKLFSYDKNSALFHLDTYYDLRLISKEDYRWGYEQIQRQAYQQAILESQQNAMAINMFMGMQSLNLQQQQLDLQERQTNINAFKSNNSTNSFSLPKSYTIFNRYGFPVGSVKEQ
ncbi:MAG: hypothetical protein DRP74_02645 [Candidatus Omnitrophota bacterium]|nr:MAG: hypothetical protein DRP74_02645 [Candidatus Omnitrophota bacterium]